MLLLLDRFPERYHGYLVVFACFLYYAGNGLRDVFSNIMPYIASVTAKSKIRLSGNVLVWVPSTLLATGSLSQLLGGPLERRFGTRPLLAFCALLTVTCQCVSYCFVYWTPLLFITFGALQGIGIQLPIPAQISLAVSWFPARSGLAYGIVVTGASVGSVLFTEAVTVFVNPKNLHPSFVNGTTLFTQPEVIARVPYSFLLIAAIYGSLNLTAFLLAKRPVSEYHNLEDERTSERPSLKHHYKSMLSNRRFLLFLMCSVCRQVAITVCYSYIKPFGLSVTGNDHLASLTLSISAFLGTLAGVVVGAIADKFGFCPTLFASSAMSAVLFFTYGLSYKTGYWLYIMWTILIFICVPGAYPVIIMGLKHYFGKEMLAVNLGLIGMAKAIGAVVLSLVATFVFDEHHFEYMFYFTGASQILIVMCVIAIACMK